MAILAARGVTSDDEVHRFLGDAAGSLHDPARLPDAAIVAERIARARERGEAVLVFGDFDADGITGLALLTLTLRRLGIEAIPYVPSRLEEGHGLSLAAVGTGAGWVRHKRHLTLPDATARTEARTYIRQIIDFANHGTAPDFFRALKDAGFGQAEPREIIDARNHGVNASALQEAKKVLATD